MPSLLISLTASLTAFFVACSAHPFASDFFDGPTNTEEEADMIVATESGVETEEQENTNEPSADRPSEEDTNIQHEDPELLLVTDTSCISPCSFSVNNSREAVRVIYKADSWEIGESQDANNDFFITYDFSEDGERNIQAYSYDVLGNLIDSDKKIVQVEIEAKFVEYNEGALEELGFDWTIYDDGDLADFSLKQGGTHFTRGSTYPVNSGTVGVNGNTIYTDPKSGAKTITPVNNVGQSLFGTSLRDNTAAFDATAQSGLLSLMGGSPATLVFQNYNDLPLDLAISAMEQEGTADVLSAPKVTTKSGNEAVIRVVEVHRYPQDYDVETGQRTAPVVKPQDWEEYDLGVVLKVTPVVDVESNTIDLDLQPEITKFLGYDSYLVGINAYESGGNNVSQLFGNSEELIARMPYFEKRSIQTQVTISDGSTVVMGGLVDERTETFRDQVPFLGDLPYIGRFFRSEGSRNQKKNLVITVKATQVDDRGMTREERELERANSSL